MKPVFTDREAERLFEMIRQGIESSRFNKPVEIIVSTRAKAMLLHHFEKTFSTQPIVDLTHFGGIKLTTSDSQEQPFRFEYTVNKENVKYG